MPPPTDFVVLDPTPESQPIALPSHDPGNLAADASPAE